MDWNTLYQRAFVPYSEKAEACIVQGTSGKYYAGVRIENISFPLTIPAVQAAACHCLSEGDTPAILIAETGHLEQLDFWVKEFDMQVVVQSSIADIECTENYVKVADRETVQTLKDLLPKSVTPNSNFPVSALLFGLNQLAVTGVNIEVSDWTMGLCAERVAIAKALAIGIHDFEGIAIHTQRGEVSSPCGACRQVMVQHLPDHPIDLYHADGTHSLHQVPDLLPFRFSAESLNKK